MLEKAIESSPVILGLFPALYISLHLAVFCKVMFKVDFNEKVQQEASLKGASQWAIPSIGRTSDHLPTRECLSAGRKKASSVLERLRKFHTMIW